MPFRYAALQNPASTQDRELEESFESGDSDIEDNDNDGDPSRPLNPARHRSPSPTNSSSTAYNFEALDYDYPPPGSPPRPSTFALPGNNIGNSNGEIPLSTLAARPQRSRWLRRTAGAILPTQWMRGSMSSGRHVGGGIENDGVFANINAKPGRGRVIEDGDSGVHVVPEEVQKEAPPSYATAQADAVPPYWETTIHTPASLGSAGEMMVDGLPTGSFFSFLWNLLVSMSFQFVGFLLTFLLHSTHAAKLGSRAGLGITLIHYGFYLRTRANTYSGDGSFLSDVDDDSLWARPTSTAPSLPKSTFSTAAEAEDYYANHPVNTSVTPIPAFPPATAKPILSEGTTEWVSFLLMTIGWFILLTSTLSFWRVKRWERSLMASAPVETPTDNNSSHAHNPFYTLQRFGFPGAVWRNGLVLPFATSTRGDDPTQDEEAILESAGELHHILPTSNAPNDIERAGRIAHARATDMRLQRDLRAAGFL